MQTCFLAPHVYGCETLRGAVLLDLRQQRYIGISAAQWAHLRPLIHNWPTPHTSPPSPQPLPPATARLLGSLQRQQLLTCAPPPAATVASLLRAPQPEGALQLPDVQAAAASLSHTVRLLRAWGRARHQMRAWPLQRILQHFKARKAAQPPRQGAEARRQIQGLAGTFARLKPLLFPRPPACLLDSLTLLEFLAQYGHHPLWVLGVASAPFRAHSWVQLDTLVLNDVLERVADFTPLLVV